MTDSETVTAEEIDRMVDEGQDMTAYIKMDTLQTPNMNNGDYDEKGCEMGRF